MNRKELVKISYQCLLNTKEDLINQRLSNAVLLKEQEVGGDETDLSTRNINEMRSLEFNDRMRSKLMEIDLALERITDGSFGVCEVTGEAIEEKRLLAIPWTRLSIEGAEFIEQNKKKYAK